MHSQSFVLYNIEPTTFIFHLVNLDYIDLHFLSWFSHKRSSQVKDRISQEESFLKIPTDQLSIRLYQVC